MLPGKISSCPIWRKFKLCVQRNKIMQNNANEYAIFRLDIMYLRTIYDT